MTHSKLEADTHPFARDNAALLRQGVEVLMSISDHQYAACDPPTLNSTVGTHIRHLLDHFACLLDDADNGRVDYDARARDPRLETDREFAIARLSHTATRLLRLHRDAGETPLRIKVDGGGGNDADTWGQSSLTRELQFLVSHTIHHYALVAAILNHAGCDLRRDFGVSPSTLRYERQRAANAS